ncbi:neurotactin [Chelonus insularis]|uniref:neurotactin n=1 Tax=Chelonus insularis TaxID=460826 RepID=UPI00158E1D5B|nr:neurotactin [Chelonus insularis]XP_034948732.1 neurotactin [Chelonus insularis]
MSQTDQEKDTSMDKKEIAEEEREKMLNEENTKHTGPAPAPDLESEEQKPKKKIPIGGIKMPGFCRTKSKEPCKDDVTKPSETGGETEGTVGGTKEENAAEKPTTPSKDTKDKDGRRGILNAIRLPLTSVFPKRKTKETDVELGATAGLASVETLEDGGEKGEAVGEDGMETVRLDSGDGVDDQGPPKDHHPLQDWIAAAKRNRLVTAAVVAILLIVIIIVAVACAGPRRLYTPPIKDGKYIDATTSCGPVQGVLEDGGFAFRGIPYALPPVNNLRWKNAEPLQRIEYCWNGTLPAYNSSSVCWQRDANGQSEGSEDCLYLDVFTPQVSYQSPLPVVVMISADTLDAGSPGIMQPSAKLARVRDMVFVRPNFRLGIFGFLAAEPLSRAAHPRSSGNYGLSDIIAVLKWVQLNIQHFGGDRDSVTVWGHRAGGTLVSTLLATHAIQEKGKNLFARAWISSPSVAFPNKPLNESEKASETFLNVIQCRDVACLRSKSAENIMDSIPGNWYHSNYELPESREASSPNKDHEWIVIDGIIVREDPLRVLQRDGPPVKVIMGTTAHSMIPDRFKDPNTTLETTQVQEIVKESLLGTYGLAEEALSRYNATLKGLVSMISDIRVVCPLFNLTSSLRTEDRDVPFYLSTQAPGPLADADSDVAAILGSYTAKTPEEKRHVSAIQQLFNQFVWHGRIIEAASKPANRKVIIVGQDILPEREHPNCDFWIKKNIVPRYARLD